MKEEEDLKFYEERRWVGRSAEQQFVVTWAVGILHIPRMCRLSLCALANIGWRRDTCKYGRVYACWRMRATRIQNHEASTNTENANGRCRIQSDLSVGIEGENEVAVWRWLFAIRPRTLPSSPKPCPERRTTSPH